MVLLDLLLLLVHISHQQVASISLLQLLYSLEEKHGDLMPIVYMITALSQADQLLDYRTWTTPVHPQLTVMA
jgi:hypothetical protein